MAFKLLYNYLRNVYQSYDILASYSLPLSVLLYFRIKTHKPYETNNYKAKYCDEINMYAISERIIKEKWPFASGSAEVEASVARQRSPPVTPPPAPLDAGQRTTLKVKGIAPKSPRNDLVSNRLDTVYLDVS